MPKTAVKESTKKVVDGLPANSFRVVGVGQDVIIESFYLYPDIAALQDSEGKGFNLEPEHGDDPNLRIMMNREVAARLANALLATLGANQQQEQPTE